MISPVITSTPVEAEKPKLRIIESTNPATGELLGQVPIATPEMISAAVNAARQAQPGWEGMGLKGRLRLSLIHI